MNCETAAAEHCANRIGTLRESTIHAQLKKLYMTDGATSETKVDGFIVDVVREDGLLVEVQTGSFASIRRKLESLLAKRRVRLVYPLPVKKTLIVCDASRTRVLYKRASPFRGSLIDVTAELVWITPLLAHPGLELEVILENEEETRSRDGKGSRWRKGVSVLDRRMNDIIGRVLFQKPADYGVFLPHNMADNFTNVRLARALGARRRAAQQLTRCLQAVGVIERAGKEGRAYLYVVSEEYRREHIRTIR